MTDAIVSKLRSRGAPYEQHNYLQSYHKASLEAFSSVYQERFQEATLLGMGGSGIVIKLSGSSLAGSESSAEQSVAPRCLKYPHPCIGLPGDFSLTDVIDNEAERLRE